jgi:hypothetical protein
MKTVKNVKNSLKFKVAPKEGLLTVRLGVKKYVLPIEARLLAGGDYLFLSFPACSEIFEVKGGKNLEAMDANADGAKVGDALRPKRRGRRTRKASAGAEMPEALAAALKAVPKGHKLVIGTDGQYRLAKTRTRTKK